MSESKTNQHLVYINGVLNDSKSLYHECEVIAERFVIPNLVVGHTYRLAFSYGWEKAVNPGHMNYDFLAGWNTTLGESVANPCGDPLGNASADIRAVCNTDHTIKTTHSGANAAFKAVRVPRGEVELELRFQPRWWSPPPPG